jgi:hypothetical protein
VEIELRSTGPTEGEKGVRASPAKKLTKETPQDRCEVTPIIEHDCPETHRTTSARDKSNMSDKRSPICLRERLPLMEKEQVNDRHCTERHRGGGEPHENTRDEQLREVARVRTPEGGAECQYGGEEIDGTAPVNVRKWHPDERPYTVHSDGYCPRSIIRGGRMITNSPEQRENAHVW